jgi:TP901 family phage tail tape measure protein
VALGTSELLLVIRASDQASRVLRNLAGTMGSMDKDALSAARSNLARGGALVALGGGIAAIGAKALGFFADATDAAGQYDTAARRAFTQVDNGTTSLEDLKKMGLDVATTIPVALEDTQKALYDIFSTVDVNTPQAQKLLTQFSRAAVAGQTDLQTATEGTLRIMNAFKISSNDVNKVNDIMFQLVRKGVGTYADFNSALGKATPSAVRAGQSLETVAGMMAFLTRNGLSASMASTSAGRAFDLISNSKVDTKLHGIGVEVKDAHGNFRSMSDITTDLSAKLADMTAPERSAALANLFKGAGNNVQARRFFDLVVNNNQAFVDLTNTMKNSSGVMDSAYNIMFKSPQAQVQLLTNKYDAMKVEIGNSLLPVKQKLLEILTNLMDAWLKLSPVVQQWIVYIAAAGAAVLVIVGIIIMLAGAFIILDTAVGILEIELLPLILIVLAVVAAIALIIAIIVLVIKYHKEIGAFFVSVWQHVRDFFVGLWQGVSDWFQNLWKSITSWVSGAVTSIGHFFTNLGNGIVKFFSNLPGNVLRFLEELPGRVVYGLGYLAGVIARAAYDAWNWLSKAAEDAAIAVMTWLILLPGRIKRWFISTALSIDAWATSTWNGLVDATGRMFVDVMNWFILLPGRLQRFFIKLATDLTIWATEALYGARDGAVKGATSLLEWFRDLPANLLKWGSQAMVWLVETGVNIILGLRNGIVNGWNAFWGWILGLIQSFIKGFTDGFGTHSPSTVFADIGMDLIRGLWKGIASIEGWLHDRIWDAIHAIVGIFTGAANWLFGHGRDFLIGLWNGILNVEGWLHDRIWDAIHRFVNIFTGAVDWLKGPGRNFLVGMWNGILNAEGWLHDRIWDVIHSITGIFSGAADWLKGAGSDLLHGIWDGINSAAGWLKGKVMDWAGSVLPGWVKNILGIKSPSRVFAEIGKNLMVGLAGGIDNHAVHAVRAAVSAANSMSDAFNNNANFVVPSMSGYAAGAVGTTGGVGGTTGGAAGNQVTVPIVINTQEINPLQHAAELGALIGTRVS